MTEEEARNKWCPMIRLAPLVNGESYMCQTNRMVDNDKEKFCIGSKCMMWRWIAQDNKKSKIAVHAGVISHWEGMGYEKGEPSPEKGYNYFWMIPIQSEEDVEGYCGLGGKP